MDCMKRGYINMKKMTCVLLTCMMAAILLTACDSSMVDGAPPVTEAESSALTDCASDTKGEEVSEVLAPDFAVLDREGKTVRLSDLRGKPVVLNFWASWCGPCKQEMPSFEAAYKKYGADVHFVMVDLTDGQNETVETAKQLIDALGYTFPIYFDTEGEAAVAYAVRSIPATYFINARGEAVTYAVGELEAELLEKGIGMILDAQR